MKFTLTADSCIDELKKNIKNEHVNVIPMTFIAGDETFKDDFSFEEQYKQFYEKISSGIVFKTASLNAVEVEEFFTKLLKEEKDIIHVSLSSGLSVTYNVVKSVADRLNETNKNKIYIVDSLSATQGQNLLLKIANECRKQDMHAHEALKKIKWAVLHLSVTFFVTDFDCLKRGGRVSGVQALIGRFASIRPVLDFDVNGKLRVISKVIGNKKALLTLSENLEKYDVESETPIFIAHTGNNDVASELENITRTMYPQTEIIKRYIGPTIGAHTGAGALGLVFLQKGERVWV